MRTACLTLLLICAGCGSRALGLGSDGAAPAPDLPAAVSPEAGADAGASSGSDAIGWSLAVDDDALYWTTASGKVIRRDKHDDGPDQVLAESGGEFATLAIDASSVYFTVCPPSSTLCSIRRVAKTGGPPTTLIEGQLLAGGLVVDEGHLYWATGDGGIVKRAKTGGSLAVLSSGYEPPGSTSMPHFIVGDAERIYWSAGGALRSISKLVGAPKGALLASPAEARNPIGLAVAGGVLYWAAAGELQLHPDGSYGYPDGELRRVPTPGGTIATIADGLPWPSGVVVGEGGHDLYFTSVTHGLLRVPNQVGTGINWLLEAGSASHVLARDATHLYWSSGGALRSRPL